MDLAETIVLEVREVIKETEKAWLVKLDDGQWWFPKSQVRIVNNKIYIPKWFADNNNINYLDIDIE